MTSDGTDSSPRDAGSDAPPHDSIARVEWLSDQGRHVEAADLLAVMNARTPRPGWEIKLIDLRAAAAASYDSGPGRSPWPPECADPIPDVERRIPELGAAELTADVLSGAVAHHGCLAVRGVFSPEQAAGFVELIDDAHRSRERRQQTTDRTGVEVARYRPLPSSKKMLIALRDRVAERGGIWLADSPTATAQTIGALNDTAVLDSIRGHFGERPFFSLQKSTLRRVLPEDKFASWHQDGAFLDPTVRTMNLWVALTPCGGDLPTPALEVVPKRVPELLPSINVETSFSVSVEVVAEVAVDAPTIIPEFAPGDALMFDERFLHRTHFAPGMNGTRYALECWMFAPSHHTPNYTPLLI